MLVSGPWPDHEERPRVDGLVTRTPGVALGVLTVALLATVALLGGFRQLKGGARGKPQPEVSWSRRRASDLVSSRETCICEMPTRAAI